VQARLAVPVVGLGASAPTWYPAVGARLHTRTVLPDHAGVANAIGAVVGQVAQRVSGIVTSPAEGRFTAHLADGLQHFPEAAQALTAMEAALEAEATARAQAAGAVDVRVDRKREVKEATIEGRVVFIEGKVTVTASGRPRVAHAVVADNNPLDAPIPRL
jgi:hypothetical protein